MLEDKDLLSVQEVRSKVDKAWTAWQTYRRFTQQQVDAIVEAMASAARASSVRLAELAVEETGYGRVKDKVIKNMLAADLLPRNMLGLKTVGIIEELPEEQIVKFAEPVGVVAAILPTTNPTSTAIYKTLIALKAGNAIVHSPHPRAKACSCATIDVLSKAATAAGAPAGLIQCVTNATLEGTSELMRHKRTSVILSTGGSGIVKAAYSSGKPAFGVGPGNVPVLLDTTSNISEVIPKILSGKTFDFGTLCSSEQTIVAEKSLRESILKELKANGAHLCDPAQAASLAKLLFKHGSTVNADCVGQDPRKIAQMAGFSVPDTTTVIIAELAGIGREHPLSAEKLSPVLTLFFVDNFEKAVDACEAILRFGGLGHTCGIYTEDVSKAREYGRRMPAFRVLVNTPTPQGSTGITTNLFPAMTLGCGAIAGNSTGDNVSPLHLINVKRLAWGVRKPEDAFPPRPPSPETAMPANITKETIASAVERYLSARGVGGVGGAGAESVESVVDRFLAHKSAAPTPQAATSCACDPPDLPKPEQAAPPRPAPVVVPPPVPKLEIAEFVCENDVRQAINQNKRIYIGPKTILTPSARDLGNQYDVLVVAQR